MAAETLGEVLRRIGRSAGLQDELSLTDAQLLERFVSRRDEPAFAALMVRHGPMVYGAAIKPVKGNRPDFWIFSGRGRLGTTVGGLPIFWEDAP